MEHIVILSGAPTLVILSGAPPPVILSGAPPPVILSGALAKSKDLRETIEAHMRHKLYPRLHIYLHRTLLRVLFLIPVFSSPLHINIAHTLAGIKNNTRDVLFAILLHAHRHVPDASTTLSMTTVFLSRHLPALSHCLAGIIFNTRDVQEVIGAMCYYGLLRVPIGRVVILSGD